MLLFTFTRSARVVRAQETAPSVRLFGGTEKPDLSELTKRSKRNSRTAVYFFRPLGEIRSAVRHSFRRFVQLARSSSLSRPERGEDRVGSSPPERRARLRFGARQTHTTQPPRTCPPPCSRRARPRAGACAPRPARTPLAPRRVSSDRGNKHDDAFARRKLPSPALARVPRARAPLTSSPSPSRQTAAPPWAARTSSRAPSSAPRASPRPRDGVQHRQGHGRVRRGDVPHRHLQLQVRRRGDPRRRRGHPPLPPH